jgi:HK97 family phage major capsid protein
MVYKELTEIEARRTAINARKSAIAPLLDSEPADKIPALSQELDNLNAEMRTLDTEAAALQARSAARGKLGEPVSKPSEGGGSDAEKRGRDLMQGRSVTVASTGVLLAEPKSTTILPTFNEVSTLIDRVNVINLPGGESFDQAYEAGYGEGGYTTEGGNPTVAEATFGHALINKTKITAYAETTEELSKLSAANYEAVVMRGIPIAVRKKLTKEILIGDGGSGHFVGIFDDGATAIDAATDIDFAEIDENTLSEIIYSYGGDENVEDVAVLVLNKLDLKAFAQLRDSNGRKIHDVKPMGNAGTIDGVPYIINSNCKAISSAATTSGQYAMAYGPLQNYTMAIFSALEIARSNEYRFKEGMICHKGVIFAGGNVTSKNGFLRIKKT